jgi:hypothetical protein
LGIGALAAVVAVASTLAANININSGPVEFGQGVAQTTACDDSITVTPRTQFLNSNDSDTVGSQVVTVGAADSGAFIIRPEDRSLFYVGMSIVFEGDYVLTNDPTEVVSVETATISNEDGYPYFEGVTEVFVITVVDEIFGGPTQTTARVGGSGFQFSGVDVSDIDATEGNCLGKTFTLKAYGDTETAALATYTIFVGENGFLSGDGNIESSNPGTSSSSFSLEFNSTRISATSVYKITIESSDYGQTFLDGRSFDFGHFGLLVEDLMSETLTPLSAQCSNGVCSADYFRADYQGGPGGDVFVLLEANPSGTTDKKWTLSTDYEFGSPYVTYGFIKYFNGTYGIFQGTEDEYGDIPAEEQILAIFSTRANLPLIDGGPGGTLTWSYPSESRYTE